MSLYTYEVTWTSKDKEGKERKGRYLRLLTSTEESIVEYMKKNYKDFVEVTKVKKEPKKTTYCERCGSVLNKNYI